MSKWPILLGLLTLPAGCGGPSTPPAGLHGGLLTPLPDGMGSVEILREDVAGKANESRLVVYFLDPSRKPISPEPTGVGLKLGGGRDAKVVELKPAEGTVADRAGALVSPPLAGVRELVGELTAKIGDKPVSVAIRSR